MWGALHALGLGIFHCLAGSALSEAGRLHHEVILFRYARRATGGDPVVCDGGLMVAGHFE